jgi:hypothetical protein
MGSSKERAETGVCEWRCASCDALLALKRGGVIHVRHGKHEAYFGEPAVVRCRRCGALSRTKRRTPAEGDVS